MSTVKAMKMMPKTIDYIDVSCPAMISDVNCTSDSFVKRKIVVHPADIKVKAAKSYCQTNFSPRIKMESVALIMIAVAEFMARSTSGQKGIITMWMRPETVKLHRPVMNFHEQTADLCCWSASMFANLNSK